MALYPTEMRRFFRLFFLVVLGTVIGLVGYEGFMFVRVLLLRNGNPSSTSLIDTRIKEAQARGQQPRREQTWVSLDKISPQLQRAVLAGEDTNFLTHHGFDYEAIQKAFEQGKESPLAKQKQKAKTTTGCQTCRSSNAAARRLASNSPRISTCRHKDRFCEKVRKQR